MQAVLRTGGKQFTVSPGDFIEVEKLVGEPGDEVVLDDVLMVSDDKGNVTVGTPNVENASVKAKIIAQKKGAKIIVFKFKRRKKFRKKQGHRQRYTALEIVDINS